MQDHLIYPAQFDQLAFEDSQAGPPSHQLALRQKADVLSETLAEDSRETRIGLSAAARKAAETLAKMPGSKVIKHAQAHRHMIPSASVLHGWDDKGNPTLITLNVLNVAGDMVASR